MLRELGRARSRGLLGHTLLYAYAAAPDMSPAKSGEAGGGEGEATWSERDVRF